MNQQDINIINTKEVSLNSPFVEYIVVNGTKLINIDLKPMELKSD